MPANISPLTWKPTDGLEKPLYSENRAPLALNFDNQHSPHRTMLERTISERFEATYDAKLEAFLPYLLSLSRDNKINAVLGMRLASEERLFLEQYLDLPIEQCVSRAYRSPIDRSTIVEIGNLAANVASATPALFAVLVSALQAAGYRWLVCTATVQVEAILQKLNFSTETLGQANPDRLLTGQSSWGRYYDAHPRVVVGDISVGAQIVQSSALLSHSIRDLSGAIDCVGQQLNCAALR
ncbi:MAG: thermostable hemolysin [Lysobacterales bacterium]